MSDPNYATSSLTFSSVGSSSSSFTVTSDGLVKPLIDYVNGSTRGVFPLTVRATNPLGLSADMSTTVRYARAHTTIFLYF